MTGAKINAYLETERLGKLMWKYTIPCVISMLVAALYNIVDQIFIANADYLESYGNAANTVVFPMTVVAIAIAVMIGDGCCTFVSISLGSKAQDNARQGIGSSSILSITREIVFGAGLPILRPMIWGLYALPFFMPVADVLSFLGVAAVMYWVIRKGKEGSFLN